MQTSGWLSSNMSPSTSVSLVDLDARELSWRDTMRRAAASSTPTEDLAFSAICADGRMLTVTLNEDGSEGGRTSSELVFRLGRVSRFSSAPLWSDGVAYFPAFDGDGPLR